MISGERFNSRRPLVLYAENDENDAALMEMCWTRAHMEPGLQIVNGGQAAIDYLAGAGEFADREAHPLPSLLLVDLTMPGCSGLDVLSWVRARRKFDDLPVVVMSLSQNARHREDALRLGASEYLIKPMGLSGFLDTLRDWSLRWFPGVTAEDVAGADPRSTG